MGGRRKQTDKQTTKPPTRKERTPDDKEDSLHLLRSCYSLQVRGRLLTSSGITCGWVFNKSLENEKKKGERGRREGEREEESLERCRIFHWTRRVRQENISIWLFLSFSLL